MTTHEDICRYTLEIRDAHFEVVEGLDINLVDGKASITRWGIEGFRQEFDVDLEAARDAYRDLRARGGVEPEAEGDEPHFDEEAAYEAEVDRRMSAVYDAEPRWAI